MSLIHIEISELRNLEHIILELDSGFNLLYGENGSGKTSFLEGIFMLGHGRSFRSRYISRIVRENQEKLAIYAKLTGLCDESFPMGIERDISGKTRIKIAKKLVESASELAQCLPIKLINPDSYQLLEAGPKYRRQFLDWGLFHVEHDFYHLWRSTQRILKQRNAALKQQLSKQQITIWDEELATVTNKLHELRSRYMSDFIPLFKQLLGTLLEDNAINLQYYSGWTPKTVYIQLLQQSFERDYKHGFTHYGPHRADLKITSGKFPAESILSRGQQKILVNTLHLAQGLLLKQQAQKSCVYLIDDLPAELDLSHRQQMVALLAQLNAQVFVTGVERRDLDEIFKDYSSKLFHVEQGCIASV